MRKKWLLLTCLYFVCTFQGWSQTPSKLKILSWNIYMLPRFIKNTGKIERAEKIGQYLKNTDYDIIVFQEAFHAGARNRIKKHLKEKFPYMAGPANKKLVSIRTNSGLWILSRHPIMYSQEIKFETKSGSDAFSRKGALISNINFNNFQIQIIATHLQSSGENWLKESQCVELNNKIIDFYKKDGVPQIICGDFNIEKDSNSRYQNMLKILNANDSEMCGISKFTYDRLNNDLHVEASKKQDLIDYILFKANQSNLCFIKKMVKQIKEKWDKKHQDLSDHYALEAEIEFKDNNNLLLVNKNLNENCGF